LRWEIGGHTRTGKAKAETHRVNEDSILIKEFEAGALMAVADGVSTCDVGSGALASMMTTIVLESAFSEGCTHQTFTKIVSGATRLGSQGLLEWALARGCRADLEAGKDLMGTTLTVGWIQDHELSLANLGDSRAYLIADREIEQLTVDGDLASDLLAQGASPMEIKELGVMARALRECVGGCTRTPQGEITILPESTTPRTVRWPLMPGDIVVLCSDGLVEEGYFLEPKTVHDIVRKYRDLPAAELALRLVEAADSLQRGPTAMEPDGFGDNISCVVIKVSEKGSEAK
jgi:serine/threonine protein phosphatase PrpC